MHQNLAIILRLFIYSKKSLIVLIPNVKKYCLRFQTFCIEVRKKIIEMASDGENFTLDHENHSIFAADHDRQLLLWLHRRPEDWTLSWGGAGTIFGWGHNHRGQVRQ